MMKTDGEIQHQLEVDQFGKQCEHVSFYSPLQVWLACGFAFMPPSDNKGSVQSRCWLSPIRMAQTSGSANLLHIDFIDGRIWGVQCSHTRSNSRTPEHLHLILLVG